MTNVRKFLVPIDFSPESEGALRYAVSLAERLHSEVIALHVIDDLVDVLPLMMMPPEGWPYVAPDLHVHPIQVVVRNRLLDLENLIQRTVPTAPRLQKKVCLGTLRDEVVALARREGIDLIVLELRKRWFFSNLANRKLLRMIDKLPFPVLLAPPPIDAKPRSGRRVLAFPPVLSSA